MFFVIGDKYRYKYGWCKIVSIYFDCNIYLLIKELKNFYYNFRKKNIDIWVIVGM